MANSKLKNSRKPRSKSKVSGKKGELDQLREEIKSDHENRRTSSHGLGQKLKKAKELKPHGGWQKWVKGNLPFSLSKAQSYMRIASTFPDMKTAALFTIRQQGKLAAKSTPKSIRKKFIERARKGEIWKNKEFKAELDRLSDNLPKAKDSLRPAKATDSPTEKTTSKPQRVANAINKLLDSIEVHLEACPLQNRAKRKKNKERLKELYLKSKGITAKLKPLENKKGKAKKK